MAQITLGISNLCTYSLHNKMSNFQSSFLLSLAFFSEEEGTGKCKVHQSRDFLCFASCCIPVFRTQRGTLKKFSNYVWNEYMRPQWAWCLQDLSEHEVCMKGSRYTGTFVPSAPLYLVTAMLSPRKAAPCVCPTVPLGDKFLECWDFGSPGPWQCSLPSGFLFSHS